MLYQLLFLEKKIKYLINLYNSTYRKTINQIKGLIGITTPIDKTEGFVLFYNEIQYDYIWINKYVKKLAKFPKEVTLCYKYFLLTNTDNE